MNRIFGPGRSHQSYKSCFESKDVKYLSGMILSDRMSARFGTLFIDRQNKDFSFSKDYLPINYSRNEKSTFLKDEPETNSHTKT